MSKKYNSVCFVEKVKSSNPLKSTEMHNGVKMEK